jgi:hypothetical protein
MQRRDGIEHACSSSVTFVVIVFAIAAVAQALVVLAALRAHRGALSWKNPHDGELSRPCPASSTPAGGTVGQNP